MGAISGTRSKATPRTPLSALVCRRAGEQASSASKWRWYSGDKRAVRGSVASRSGAGGCALSGREKKSTLTFFYRYVILGAQSRFHREKPALVKEATCLG